jgi:hypothetical protein
MHVNHATLIKQRFCALRIPIKACFAVALVAALWYVTSWLMFGYLTYMDVIIIFEETDGYVRRSTQDTAVALASMSKKEQDRLKAGCCDLAAKESNGFFNDIPDSTWQMFKLKAQAIAPNTRGDARHKRFRRAGLWFQNHYEPDFTCQFERRIGRLGDGGKWVCDPHRITNQPECLVYSVGSNGDASFERAVLEDVGSHCEIHVFDFGDYAKTVTEQTQRYSRNGVHYHRWGISDRTAGMFKSLKDTVQELGHQGRVIDIFKIDCEGCELDSYSKWTQAGVELRQILVEIHSNMFDKWPYMDVKLPETADLFEYFYKEGYVITHKEPNTVAVAMVGIEYSFLKLTPAFLQANVSIDT